MKLQRKLVIILSVLTTLAFSFGISNVMQQNKYGEFDRSEQQRQNVAGTEVNIESDKTYEEKELATNASKRTNASELYTSQELDEAEPENKKEVNNDEVENEETGVRTAFGAETTVTKTYIMQRESGSTVNGVTTYYAIGALRSGRGYKADSISTITFKKGTDAPTGTESTWNVSYDKSKMEVLAFAVPSSTVSGKYDLYIGTTGDQICLPASAVEFFAYYTNLTEIKGIELLDSSDVTDMRAMFYGDTNLKSIDLSTFNTTKLTSTWDMFNGCTSITSIDLSSFNTSNVQYFIWMFYNCKNLKILKINKNTFTTSNVTNMSRMFYNCSSLAEIDVSNFDTSKVTTMEAMFYNCSSVLSLDVSNFNTINSTSMWAMFYNCNKIEKLDLNKFNTSNVTNMAYMFSSCSNLKHIVLGSNFDTTKVTTMKNMFASCTKLKTIILNKSITSVSEAPKLLTSSSDKIGLESLTEANLYVPNKTSEKLYEQATNYKTIFASSYDTSNDIYRIQTLSENKLMKRENSTLINGEKILYIYGAKLAGKTQYTADLVKTITLKNSATIPADAIDSWSVDYAKGENKLWAWIVKNASDTSKYDLYIGGNYQVLQAPEDLYNFFAGYTNCTSINGLNILDTTNVTDMSFMFYNCKILEQLDLSNFKTSNVTTMQAMFYDANKLTAIDVSSFDTSKVKIMSGMFSGYDGDMSLTEIKGLEKFNTTNVTTMKSMFQSCISLKALDLSNFDTSNVTDMSHMFTQCKSLTNLNISKFNTSKVTNMRYMFNECTNLVTLNISNFNTSNVSNMQAMFNKCNSLEEVDVSGFNTSATTSMSSMFAYCNNLKNIDTSNFDTSKVTTMRMMFFGCHGVTNLNVNSFKTSNVTDMYYLFGNCYALTQIDISNFDTTNVTTTMGMFSNDKNLETIKFGKKFDTSKVTEISYMFYNCAKLKNLDTRVLNTLNVKYMRAVFFGCSGLQVVDLSNFDTTNVIGMSKLIEGCTNLKAVILNKTITSSDQALKLITGDDETKTYFEEYPNVILYVPDPESEKLYEQAENYSTIFADSRDENGNLYRIRPILELAGDNPIKIVSGSTYDETKDAGVTIAGFDKANAGNYTQYGYDYTVTGLPVDTSTAGTKQVIYTLTSTKNGTTTNGMTATRDVNVVGVPMLMERESSDYINGKGKVYYAIGAKRSGNTKYTADLISTITFVNNTNIPTTAEGNWDVSYTSGDGDVIAWVIPNTTDSTKYDLYIGTNDTTIQAPANSNNLFVKYKICTAINNLTILDTSKVTDMNGMFWYCSRLTSLDVSNFDTSNVTNMGEMFYYCGKLTSLDVSNFNTSKVTYMGSMFFNCSNLTELNVSNFDTTNVTNMSWMFSNCSNLTSLDLSSFNTSKVTNMRYVFYNCSKLTSLDVSNFNTLNVTNMSSMFYNCSKLTSLDVSKFDTSKVTDMGSMFDSCSSLINLDVSNFNTTNVTDMGGMFDSCSSLINLDVSGFNTSKVTGMQNMFHDCSKLTSLDVSGFDTSKVKSMGFMFKNCNSLKSIDLRSFDTSNLDGETYSMTSAALGVDVNYMFWRCENLESIIIGDKFNRLDGYDMFKNCNKLKAIITTKTITASSDAPTLSGTENVTNSNGKIIAGPNGLINLPNAILYVPDTASEKLYEAATNYSTTFADSRDESGDLYRVRPILELVGDNSVKTKINSTYDETKDAGVTIAGFDKTNASNYTQYGYNYTTSGLPVDTTTKGTKQVTYTLTKTENGTTTNGMTATRDVKVVGVPMLMERESSDYINNRDVYYAIGAKRSGNKKYTADLISTITFVNNTNIPSTSEASWDVSYTSGDGDVIAWVIPNVEDSTKYDLYIGTNDTTIQAPANPNNLFVKYKICTAINNLTILDTSKVTDMTWMFSNCSNLTSLDLSSFNTSKVTNMGSMFYSCSNLTSLDLSNFDTSKVTDMGGMFDRCSSLINLDVSNFDTSKVTDMAWMFYNCSKLTSLDLSSFNTSSVTYMDFMFYNCSKLTSLDLSNFNTSNVTNMSNMFYECESLTTLDVSKFNTSKVTNMHYMFRDCSELTNLDVSNFDTSKVTDMGGMFDRCSSLINLDVSKFDTSNVTNMSYMFDWCRKLTSLDVSNFDTSKVTNMSSMFYYCSKLTSLDVSNFNTSKVTDMSSMFDRCSNLTSLDVSKFDTTNVTNMESMFSLCSNLTSLDVNNFNTSNVTNMGCMFNYCGKLTNLNLSNFDTSNVTNMENMFSNCSKLSNLDVSKLNTSNVTNMRYMFTSCSNLTSLDVSNFNTSNVTNMYYMFKNCRSLTNLDVSKFDTSKVTNMGGMFDDCSSLINLDVSNFNTSNVTNMGGMFDGCSKLTSLDVSGFDTSKVKSMGFMFSDCTNLKNIDLRSFDTSSLDGKTYNTISTALGVDVNYMFYSCGNLESIIIGDKFNRLDGYDMFKNCNKLKAIITTKTITVSSDAPTLSGTENVTNSNGKIIAGPNDLKNLPNAILYAPDTASEKLYEAATNYSTTFADSRDESGDLYRVRPILELVGDNPVKAKINSTYDETVDAGVTIAGFDKANASNYTQYGYNYTVTGLPVDTSVGGSTKQVIYTLVSTKDGTTTNGMSVTRNIEMIARPVLMTPSSGNIFGSSFSKETVTKFVILNDSTNAPTNYVENGKWDVSAPGYEGSVYAYLVLNADGATHTLYVVADGTIEVTVGCDLFANYTNLTSIEGMEYLDTSKVTDMSWMFANSPKLTSINISMLDTSSATDMTAMFYKCEGVTSINLSGIDTSKVTNMSKSGNAHLGMFESCTSLTSIDVSGFDTSSVTYMRSMFRNCQKLVSLDLRNFDTSSSPAMDNFLLNDGALKTLVLGSKVTNIIGDSFINNCGNLETIIVQSTTPINFGDSNNYLNGKVILYVPNTSEMDYEANTKLATLFGTGRIKPILELNGESDVTTGIGTTYVDAGAVVAGFDKASASEYMKYGYTLTSTSSVDTSKTGSYKVTYILTYSVKGESTTRTETVVRNVVVNKPVLEAPTSANIFGSSFKKDTVTKIVIANSFDKAPSAYVENGRWDISATGYEGSVYAYLALNTDGTTHTLYIVAGGTIEVTNGCDLFSHYSNCTSIEGMENLNTSNVTDMSWMFSNSSSLTDIDISMLDTSKVTTMEAMFYDCQAVKNINLNGIDTSKVKYMGKSRKDAKGMFEGCTSLTNIDTTQLNIDSVISTSAMFKDCSSLTSIDFSGRNLNAVTDMNSMFSGCSNATTINLAGTTTRDVTDLGDLFYGCSKLTDIDLSVFDTSNVINMKNMFRNCQQLISLDLRSFDTSNSPAMDNFLLNDNALKILILGPKVTNIIGDSFINSCGALEAIIAQSTTSINFGDSNNYFNGKVILYVPSASEADYEADTKIASWLGANRIKPILQLVGESNIAVGQGSTYVDAGATVAGFDKANESYYTQYGYTLTSTSSVNTSKNGVYKVTYTLTYPVHGETTSRTETVTRMVVVNRPVLMAPTSANIFGSDFKKDTVTKIIITDSFDNAPASHIANGYWDISAAGYEGTVFACLTLNSDNATHTLYIIAAETIEVTNGCDLFSNFPKLSSIEGMENLNTSNVTDMSWMFSNSSSLTDIDISMLDTSKVTTMEAMFYECKAVKNINIKGIDTSKVKYMGKSRKYGRGMFEGCTSLVNVDISQLNMDSLVSTSSMFKDCSSLTSIDFSGRNLNAVTDMNSMFSGCSNATTINLTGTTTRDVTDLGDLFYNCSKLTDIDFSGFSTSKVTTITSLVNGCAALTKVDLSTFDTSNVINMSALLNNATILKEIILGDSFTTGKVTDMSYMFNGCNTLESLDLSNFDTSNVTTMQNMFWKCNSVTQITFGPNFNTASVTNMDNMFRNCYALTTLDLSAFDTTNVTTMNNFLLSAKALKTVIFGEKFDKFLGSNIFNQNNSLEMIIAQNPTAITISGANYMNDKAILYVPTATAEKLYESADGYATLFSSADDTADDIDRIRPILELIGDSVIEIDYNSEYVDAGATVLGFGSGDETEYKKYGYTLEVSGLPVDTSACGKHEVKYTLNYTRPGTTTTTKVDEAIRTINIESADISNMEITLAKDSYIYTGTEIEPQVTITDNGKTLEEGVDYVVNYTDNIDVGTATVTIIGIGNYVGIITKNFEITPAEITGYVTISGDPTYGGQLHIDFSNVVPASADFTFEWFYNLANSTEGGTRLNDNYGVPESNDILTIDRDLVGKYIYTQVTVTADNYNTKVLTAIVGPVKARNINELDVVLGQEVLVYDGNEKRPGVFIYDNYTGKELVFNTDYTLVYKDNVEVGTATVIITGDGDYKGERSLTFLIVALPTVKVENITPEWRSNDTILQITIVDSGAGIHKVTFTGGTHSGDDITLTNNVATVTVDENGYYYFEVYDIYNNVVTGEALVNNIDKNAPIIENVAYDSDTFTTKVIVTVRANDMESGVYAYSISSSQSTPTTWKKLDLSENLVSFDAEITTNGTWYLFVRDLVGNVTMYDKAITIKNIDNAVPVIKLFDIAEDYTFTAEVFIQVKAEDDTGVTEILLSNQLLTTSQAESSAGWIPFTETILYTLPNKDGEHTVYAWVRDSVGKISEMASDSTMLLQKYVGNNGINSTSFKFLVKDENYDFANKLTGANIKIAVKDDNGDVTYSTDYGMNITSITLPTVYGPQQEGTQIMSGEYYTITVDNLRGKGTVCLIFDDSAIADMAGNRLESTEIKTDVMVELNAPTISLGATEIQVSDAENNLVQAIKINDKTVLLTGGKITYAKLESDYGITLKTGDRIEAYDKCGNTSAVEVQ